MSAFLMFLNIIYHPTLWQHSLNGLWGCYTIISIGYKQKWKIHLFIRLLSTTKYYTSVLWDRRLTQSHDYLNRGKCKWVNYQKNINGFWFVFYRGFYWLDIVLLVWFYEAKVWKILQKGTESARTACEFFIPFCAIEEHDYSYEKKFITYIEEH